MKRQRYAADGQRAKSEGKEVCLMFENPLVKRCPLPFATCSLHWLLALGVFSLHGVHHWVNTITANGMPRRILSAVRAACNRIAPAPTLGYVRQNRVRVLNVHQHNEDTRIRFVYVANSMAQPEPPFRITSTGTECRRPVRSRRNQNGAARRRAPRDKSILDEQGVAQTCAQRTKIADTKSVRNGYSNRTPEM